jgi:methylglyoxal synthase
MKSLALIAHDNLKPAMIDWAKRHRGLLEKFALVATGTTGSLLEAQVGLPILKMKSGPLGGDQQIGARVAEGRVDALIFFWDPMSPHPHDVDVRALLRLAVLADVPVACNQASADLLMEALGRRALAQPEFFFGVSKDLS